jgi:hypothetical protein
MSKVLGIIYRGISIHLIHKAALQLKTSATGTATLIQRFGSALNLAYRCREKDFGGNRREFRKISKPFL